VLGTHLTPGDAAAPSSTLTAVVAVPLVAAVTCVPSLVFLYSLEECGRLDAEA